MVRALLCYSRAQFLHAVRDCVSPGLLIPVNPERWIAIAVVWNESIGLHAAGCLNELSNGVQAAVPFDVEFFVIQLQPRLERSEAAIAPSRGLQFNRAASIRSLRPRSKPLHCGPQRPFPPQKQ